MNKLLLSILFLTTTTLSIGSRLPEDRIRPLPTYSFIKYEQNRLEFPGERLDFNTFYNKLDTLLLTGSKRVSILHIGGSHVQAGHMSHRLRTNFVQLSDSMPIERGVIFPFKALKTNSPKSYNITHSGLWEGTRCVKYNGTDTLGISGAAISTQDSTASLAVAFAPYDSLEWSFNRLRIMGYASDTLSHPYTVIGEDTIRACYEEATHSYLMDLPMPLDSVCIHFHLPEQARFTCTGILPEHHPNSLVYHAAGINGADVPAWLRCRYLPGDLQLISPDLAIFGIGINDANVLPERFSPEKFKDNYRQLIRLFKEANPNCALLFITNNDCLLNIGRKYGKRTNPNTAKVVKAFKELAEEFGGAVWDQYKIMGGARSSAVWKTNKLMRPDRIHFTAEGYQLIADMLFNAIITDYTQHRNGI